MKPFPPLRAALLVALLMIAYQVASKAVRDAFYLGVFPASALPPIVIGSALLSIALVPVYARRLARWGPGRLLPAAFVASGVTLFALWALRPVAPRATAILLYLHVAVLGPMFVSGFWGLVAETFDARAAKRQIGWIGACGTAGGVLGGALTFVFAGPSVGSIALPALAMIHLACAGLVPLIASPRPRLATDVGFDLLAGAKRLAHDGYLARLALMVTAAAACAGLLDYAFKAELAAGAAGAHANLLRGFSLYYGAVALLTFLAQLALAGPVLARLGPAGSAALLPVTAGIAGIGALFAPGATGVAVARGAENVARNSMFRSGYELLFAPLDESERRANKPLIDVAAERAGDMLGALLVAALLGLGMTGRAPMLLTAVALAIAALGGALWFRGGYLRRIESRLGAHDVQTTGAFALPNTPSMSMEWSQSIDLGTLSGRFDLSALRGGVDPPEAAPGDLDAAARSGSSTKLRVALQHHDPLDAAALRIILPLLARERFASAVLGALHHPPEGLAGSIVDFMLDPTNEMAARRRLPRILSRYDAPDAIEGLVRGLSDARFEMRVQCGRALLRLHERLTARGRPGIDRDRILAAVLREVDVGRPVWEAQGAGRHEDWGEETPLVEHVLRERANASLAHVFTLLAAVLPRQPLEQAVRGLQGGDPMRRGLALEYLEGVLPEAIRARLWPFLEAEAAPRPAAPRERSLADLIAGNESIVIDLDELRKMEAMGRAALEQARTPEVEPTEPKPPAEPDAPPAKP